MPDMLGSTTFSTAAVAIAALTPVTALAEEGLFIAAGIGSADLSESFDGFDVDTDSTAYRITVGWRFNDYIAVDAGYHNFGRFDQTFDVAGTPTSVSLKADGFTIGGVGSLPLTDRMSLFARAGAFFWDGESLIGNVDDNVSDVNAHLAAGIRAMVYKNLSVTVDWSRFDLDGTNADLVAIGLQLAF